VSSKAARTELPAGVHLAAGLFADVAVILE
jgi:hypothetical protein